MFSVGLPDGGASGQSALVHMLLIVSQKCARPFEMDSIHFILISKNELWLPYTRAWKQLDSTLTFKSVDAAVVSMSSLDNYVSYIAYK